jgi:hypothetical protein
MASKRFLNYAFLLTNPSKTFQVIQTVITIDLIQSKNLLAYDIVQSGKFLQGHTASILSYPEDIGSVFLWNTALKSILYVKTLLGQSYKTVSPIWPPVAKFPVVNDCQHASLCTCWGHILRPGSGRRVPVSPLHLSHLTTFLITYIIHV